MTAKPAASVAVGHVASTLVIAWARIAEQVLRNGFSLWKVPAELADAEDATLGVGQTSVLFAAPGTDACLRCASAKEVPSGRPIAGNVSLKPTTYTAAAGAAYTIEVCLPPNAAPGLYEITIEDETSLTRQSYLLPFGVPGRRR
jgi:hypothetical protein